MASILSRPQLNLWNILRLQCPLNVTANWYRFTVATLFVSSKVRWRSNAVHTHSYSVKLRFLKHYSIFVIWREIRSQITRSPETRARNSPKHVLPDNELQTVICDVTKQQKNFCFALITWDSANPSGRLEGLDWNFRWDSTRCLRQI